MYKLDLEQLYPKLRKNREAHVDYLKKATEHSDTLRDIVKQARSQQPLDIALDYACKFTIRIQELLVYASATCPSSLHMNEKLVAITPMNKRKKVRLSQLNFGTINELAKQGLVRGLPKLKYQKDHLYSACSLGKRKKHTHKPKFEDSNQEKLYLLHMGLCSLMRIKSINGKKYILVIVDDYSRNIRTDNGTDLSTRRCGPIMKMSGSLTKLQLHLLHNRTELSKDKTRL
ncbi:hypothetical protein Tco_0456039 [Tanacetum coccineum]